MIKRLEAALRENRSLSELLVRFDEIDLPECWLVAGAVAQTVWNLASGYPAERGIKDADIAYFDAEDLSAEAEAAHEARIRVLFAHLPIKLDVKNEARVHLWYEKVFGYSIPPYIRREVQSRASRPRRPPSVYAGATPVSSIARLSASKICSASCCGPTEHRSRRRFTRRRLRDGDRCGRI
jgi:hypothetical protein